MIDNIVGGGGIIPNDITIVRQSTAGNTQKLTISGNVVAGSNQACRACLIHCPEGNSGCVHVTIANRVAVENDFLIPKGQVIPIPVDNVSDLHFYGTNNGDLVYILWRN